jgi:hypothetical protein
MLRLPKAQSDLKRLTQYLTDKGFAPSLNLMKVEHSHEEDARNFDDPRGFCHVTNEAWIIYCAQAIEDVRPEVRIALLLHELFHLYLDALSGDESEIDVDSGVLEQVPEAGYHYLSRYKYIDTVRKKVVVAKNLQCVSSEFVNGRLA